MAGSLSYFPSKWCSGSRYVIEYNTPADSIHILLICHDTQKGRNLFSSSWTLFIEMLMLTISCVYLRTHTHFQIQSWNPFFNEWLRMITYRGRRQSLKIFVATVLRYVVGILFCIQSSYLCFVTYCFDKALFWLHYLQVRDESIIAHIYAEYINKPDVEQATTSSEESGMFFWLVKFRGLTMANGTYT